LPAPVAARLVAALAGAVQFAHEQGVIHRDLKPANVLLSTAPACGFASSGASGAPEANPQAAREEAVPKIADFGLARWLGDEVGLSRTGVPVGTPSYMAPEQAEGKKAIGPAADVWALGAILYECLTGRPPFKGTSTVETLALVLQAEPVPPRPLN